jgi:plastocyanin
VRIACLFLLATAVAIAASIGGMASASSRLASGVKTQPASGDCPAAMVRVDIMGTWQFVPDPIDIVAGTTVCWTNQDGWTHTVTSDTGAFDSGVIGLTQKYCFTFDEPGSYAYHDELHPLTGTVNVEPGPPPPPAPECPPPPAPPPASCPDGAVVIDVVQSFNPTWEYVLQGRTVCWWNRSYSTRRVVSDTGEFDSGEMQPDSTYFFTFEAPGSYSYHEASTRWPGKVTVDTDPSSWFMAECREGPKRVDVHRPNGFEPPTVEVAPGTTVCWKNQDGWLHTVTSDTGAFDSGVMPLGDTYSFTFEDVGSYAYHDALYPELTATVSVRVPSRARSFRVPRVIGLRLSTAKARIRRSHGSIGRIRRVRSKRAGRVIGQKPAAGKWRARGARVSLVVGRR